MYVAVTLDQLLKQENIVLEFWTTRKRRIDQCQQYVVLETSAKQVVIPVCDWCSSETLWWNFCCAGFSYV